MSNSPGNDQHNATDLVVKAKSDRAALGELYDRFFPTIYRYCRRRLDAATVDDVTAEVFLYVARAIRGFTGETEADFLRWTYRIASNAIAAQRRRQARRGNAFERVARWQLREEAQPANAPVREEHEAIARALRSLSSRDEKLISLRYLEELSYEDIGRIVKASPATARAAVSRAMRKLRDKLTSQQPTVTRPD